MLYNVDEWGEDSMSNEFEKRRHKRMLKRKKRNKNIRLLSLVAVIVLFCVFLIINAIVGNINENKKNNPDFIFNGYIYPQPPPKNFDILVDAAKADGVKKAYLTFDDGPNNSVTTRVLDVLRRYNVKATFFMVGTLVEQNPHIARRVYEEGHLLANHSYSHKYSELYADTESFMSQINKSQEKIIEITGNPNYPKICRFPGGSYNSGHYGEIKQECKVKLDEAGYRHCDWNSLTGDSELADPSASHIMTRLQKTVGQKEDVVILMHDAPAKKITAQTLPDVIEYLIECGYEFDTLDRI